MTGDIQQLAPIAESKRIGAMDVLRGFALIGILLMNIEWFNRPIASLGGFDNSLVGSDHAFGWFVRCFVEGKFYKLFALLFGMGFAVMLIRAKEAERPFGAWFVRRMLVLLVLGLLHMVFLWNGDILHDYAFAGLILLGWVLLLRKERLRKFDNPGSFLKIALTWISLPVVAATIAAIGFGITYDHDKLTEQWERQNQVVAMVEARLELPVEEAPEDEKEEEEEESEEPEKELTEEEEVELLVSETVEFERERDADIEEEITAFTQTSYWAATKFRFWGALNWLKFTPVLTFTMLLPIFLLGYWFISSGVLRNHREHQHIFKPMAWLGMSFGLFFTVGGLMVIQSPPADISGPLRATGETLFFVGQYALAAGYLGVIVTRLGSPRWAKGLGRLAPMGRMALTNYIMHSVILTSVFYGYAGGMFGQLSRAPQMLIVAIIIIFQMYFSAWWLERYRFGPLEWVWRSLTYKSVQPMRVVNEA